MKYFSSKVLLNTVISDKNKMKAIIQKRIPPKILVLIYMIKKVLKTL